LLIVDAAYSAVVLVFSHLENYMQSLYPSIHSTPDDWIALTSAAAAQYLPHTKESLQISHVCMKNKVLLHPQEAVKHWKRLKLFEAEVIDGKASEYHLYSVVTFNVIAQVCKPT
jgi:hypothetical protein